MLCVKPTDDENLKNEILGRVRITGDKPDVLTAVENGCLLGYAALDPVGSELKLADFSITSCKDPENPTAEDMEIAEYLVRAAGNYAYNRLMSTLSYDSLAYKALLKRFRFEEINNKLTLDIKVLFKKCENCSNNH
ncbi:MAG: hypothetical protein ACI4F2_05655 [Acutalibacteraceae bacterium]